MTTPFYVVVRVCADAFHVAFSSIPWSKQGVICENTAYDSM